MKAKRIACFIMIFVVLTGLWPITSYANENRFIDGHESSLVEVQLLSMGEYGGNLTGATWYWPIHGYTSTSSAYSKISSSYGYRGGSFKAYHNGVDIGEPNGTAVYSVRSGTVAVVDNSTSGSEGRSIIINHNDGYYSVYMHLSSINVSQGQSVNATTQIGAVGGSGFGSETGYAYHLHLGIHYGSSFDWQCNVNPCPSGYTRIGESLQASVGGYPVGSASISYSINSTPLPSKPAITSVSVNHSNVTVSWNSEKYATEYICEIVKAETGFPLACDPNRTYNTSCEFSLPEGSYYAYVIALNSSGRSEASEWYLFGVSDAKPAPPIISNEDPTYYFKGDIVTISWNAVPGADTYSYYLARYPTGYAYQTPVASGIISDTSVSFYDLPVGNYKCFVHANNSFGQSPQSNWVEIIVNDIDYVPVATQVYNNHIYALYDNWTSWSYAKELTEKMGGHLVTITSKEENEFVKTFMNKGQFSGYWIGLTDEHQGDNNFEWITEETFEFSNWAQGEPNNWGEYGNREDYVQIHKEYGYDWIDTSNYSSTTVGFILEIDLDNIIPSAEQVYNGSKYILFDHNMTWTEAYEYCESLGGHLVTINSEQEYEFISQFLEQGKRSWYFMGAVKSDGIFKWLDDNKSVATSGTQSHWLDGYPTLNEYSNYMMMYKSSKKWNELKNFYEYSDHMKHLGFVCEVEIPHTKTSVTKISDSHATETLLCNIDTPCEVIVAGYKGDEFITMGLATRNGQVANCTLEGDIDKIKVMVWNSLSEMSPLCESEVVLEDEWIIE